MSATKIIKAFAKKFLTKDKGSGIISLPGDFMAAEKAAQIEFLLSRAGIPLEQLDDYIRSEADLVKFLNIIEATNKPKVYSGQAAADQLNKMFLKKGEVFDLKGKKLDPNKPIMGGTQDDTITGIMTKVDERMTGINKANKKLGELIEEKEIMYGKAPKTEKNPKIKDRKMFKEANERFNNTKEIEEAIDNASPGFAGDRKYDAQLVADDLAEKRFGKEFYDLDQKQQMDLYDQALQGLAKQRKKFDPEDMAQGGRAGFKIGEIVKKNIPEEYRLYLKSILPGGEEGKVDESYFTKKFKKELRSQALDKFLRTGKTRGIVTEGDQHRGDPTINKLIGFPSTYAALGTYTYDIDPKTMDVKITDKYDFNPAYGSKTIGGKTYTGYVGDKEGTDVGLGMFKDKFKESIRDKSVDTANVLEMIGNYFGGKQSEGKGFDVDIDIPMEEATTATEGSFAKGGRAGHYTGGMVDVEPSLSDIGHGSDALMARTRLISPGAQGTTSTGLNYLLAEDNDNIRVPFRFGGMGPGEVLQDKKKMRQMMENFLIKRAPFGILTPSPKNLNIENLKTADRPPEPEFKIGPYDPQSDIDPFSKDNVVEFDDGTFMYKDTGKYYKVGEEDEPYEVPGPSKGAKIKPIVMEAAEGGRIGFQAGGSGRRAFLKLMAALTGGVAAAKSGILSFGGKGTTKQVAKELSQVPIKNIDGMPAWFKPLVNKVIKEGTEIESGAERVIVHKTKLPNSKTDVYVEQNLNTGDVTVDVGSGKHGFEAGHLGQPARLEYKAAEFIEPDLKTGKGGMKTKEEFTVEEAEFTGGHPENVKFEESIIEKFGDHGSNFDEVEMFATGKVNKSKPTKKAERTEFESGKAEADAEAAADMADDFASGGRIGFSAGSLAKLGITGSSRRFLEKVFGKQNLDTMIKRDPDMHRGLLEVVEMFRNRDKEGLKMYMQKFLPHMDDATIEDFIIGSGGTEGIEGQLIRLGSGRDYKTKIDMINEANKNRKLVDLEVTEEMKRKPNALGGLAKLLGE
jgi:hypothetical protein